MSQEAVIYATSAMRDRPSSELIAQKLGDKLKIIQGEKDQVIPIKDMLERTETMEAELIILSEVAHMSHLEETGDLELILADFLK